MNASDRTELCEKTFLGMLIACPPLLHQIDGLITADDFATDIHRLIFRGINELRDEGKAADRTLLTIHLGDKVDAAYLTDLASELNGYTLTPDTIKNYAAKIRVAHAMRGARGCGEELNHADDLEHLQSIYGRLQDYIDRANSAQSENWRGIFHTPADLENAEPFTFAIDDFLPSGGITLIGGLSGHAKTFTLLSMVKALSEGSPLFGHELFSVPTPAERILYLIPESSIAPFVARLKMFGLGDYVREGKLLIRTLQHPTPITISDPRLLRAAEGSHVFLDTVTRFVSGDESSAEDVRPFADSLFALLAAGAKSVVGAHHSPKSFENADRMTLENILRGSGDLGAALSACWGVRQIDAETNRIFVQNVKARDFQPCGSFILEGRPHLDRGQFHMLQPPGMGGELRDHIHKSGEGGRPERADKAEKLTQALRLRVQQKSINAISKQIGIPRQTLEHWLFDYDSQQKGGTA